MFFCAVGVGQKEGFQAMDESTTDVFLVVNSDHQEAKRRLFCLMLNFKPWRIRGSAYVERVSHWHFSLLTERTSVFSRQPNSRFQIWMLLAAAMDNY